MVRNLWGICFALFLTINPVWAHVKWFLQKSEEEILRQAKPEIFSQLSVANLIPILLAFFVFLSTIGLSRRFSGLKLHRQLLAFAEKNESLLNAIMALCLAVQLINCSLNSTLFAPNFVVCDHCPKWLLPLEFLVGCGLILGLCTRLCALAMLVLLGFTFFKHGLIDSLDLLPFYGLASYFLISGRHRYSLDYFFHFQSLPTRPMTAVSHLVLRWLAGLGFVCLGLNEKLFHPQLALELLKHYPALNFMGRFGFGDDLFVLCAWLGEVVIGAILLFGTFPRIAVFFITALFFVTNYIFGVVELVGHAPYYGILLAILFRGAGSQIPVRFPKLLVAAFHRLPIKSPPKELFCIKRRSA